MDGLIFVGVIILISIIESMSRSRKAQRKLQDEAPTEPERFEWAQTPPWEADLPTYDEDSSYDDAEEEDDDAQERPISERPVTAPDGAGLTGAEVAADIWAEITGLAIGRVEQGPARARSIPRQSPPLPERTARSAPSPRPLPQPPAPEVQDRPGPPRPREEHRVHLAHAEYGTAPSERAPSEQDGLDPLSTHLGADLAAMRVRLLSHDASALRQAIVLQEVLGPPAALQRDRLEG